VKRGFWLRATALIALAAVFALPFGLAGCSEDAQPQAPTGGGSIGIGFGLADSVKVGIMEKYAPRVYLAVDGLGGSQSYRPSSFDWFAQYVDRVKIDGQYWVQTKTPLSHATEVQSFFYGPADSELDQVPTYAFWVEDPTRPRVYADLVYFFFYPYNRGKEILSSVWGNHVGDWEHVTIRIKTATLTPSQAALSAHAGGEVLPWSDLEKTADGHPIVYSAWGSHANYSSAGDHTYKTISVPPLADINITDRTSNSSDGVAWDTWNQIETFDHYAGRGLGSAAWPTWMSTDFAAAGADPTNPRLGAIYRWGNTEETCGLCLGSLCWDFPDICLLENGPTGPVSKSGVWDVDVLD
jgi:hypothetical protein